MREYKLYTRVYNISAQDVRAQETIEKRVITSYYPEIRPIKTYYA